ncbi:DUF5959 family protein [Streptomyces sp. NPDC048491]|uniref:DUF5959 family protein n=1 Tax=Streptomyces sp. NPDC048491 TaxID=3157207 RepID=UPI00343AE069
MGWRMHSLQGGDLLIRADRHRSGQRSGLERRARRRRGRRVNGVGQWAVHLHPARTGEHDCPEVVVEDESGSMVTVRVPLVPLDDWIADHRQRLHQVMNHWVPMLSA